VQNNRKNKIGLSFLVAVCGFAISAGSAVKAQDSMASIMAPERAAAPAPFQRQATAGGGGGGGQYFVEFRSRYAKSYGHTFVVFGRVGQRITARDVAGLHPHDIGEESTNWVIGHFVPVPSETGASDGDTEEKYISARYRVTMNKAQFDRVVAYIHHKQATSPTWSAELYNCNAFVADIAQFMGLKTPKSTLIYPKVFVTNLRNINTHPSQPDTLVSDNMKEMQSPTRDGQAMAMSGIHVVHEDRAAAPRRATVTIGNIRADNGTVSSADEH
jgi:hypothetical protein